MSSNKQSMWVIMNDLGCHVIGPSLIYVHYNQGNHIDMNIPSLNKRGLTSRIEKDSMQKSLLFFVF